MNEYISRECVLKKLQMQLLDLEADQDKGEYSELCENRGQEMPLTNVQPVKHGRWIDIYEYCKMKGYKPSGMGAYHWCSECEKAEIKISNYCPNCGARMDGDEK